MITDTHVLGQEIIRQFPVTHCLPETDDERKARVKLMLPAKTYGYQVIVVK